MTIKAPAKLVPDQRVADFYQTGKMNPEGTCMTRGATMAALCHELLWLRQVHGAQIQALKVTLGATELLEPDELPALPLEAPLFE